MTTVEPWLMSRRPSESRSARTRRAFRAQVRTVTSPACACSSSRCPRWTAMVVSGPSDCAKASTARANVASTGKLLSALSDGQARGLAQEVDLPVHRTGEMRVEVCVVGIGGERAAGVGDGLVNPREILLDDLDRLGIEAAAALGQ